MVGTLREESLSNKGIPFEQKNLSESKYNRANFWKDKKSLPVWKFHFEQVSSPNLPMWASTTRPPARLKSGAVLSKSVCKLLYPWLKILPSRRDFYLQGKQQPTPILLWWSTWPTERVLPNIPESLYRFKGSILRDDYDFFPLFNVVVGRVDYFVSFSFFARVPFRAFLSRDSIFIADAYSYRRPGQEISPLPAPNSNLITSLAHSLLVFSSKQCCFCPRI